MAENKRSDYERERDREEIAALLARNRRMSHQRIADTLNRRRAEEYRRAVSDALGELGENDPIPDIPPPYTITRQQVDYDVRVLEKEFRRRAAERFETAKGYQLVEVDELLRTAWADYERSKRPIESEQRQTKAIELRTTEKFDAEDDSLTRRIVVPATAVVERKKREAGYGDPRFLQIIDRGLERRARLMNLETEQIDLNLPGADIKLVAGFDPATWDQASPDSDENSNTEAETDEAT